MVSNKTAENRGIITANRELGSTSQKHHNSDIDHYPPITYQLNNLNNTFNIWLKRSEPAYPRIYQLHKLDMDCYFKTF